MSGSLYKVCTEAAFAFGDLISLAQVLDNDGIGGGGHERGCSIFGFFLIFVIYITTASTDKIGGR